MSRQRDATKDRREGGKQDESGTTATAGVAGNASQTNSTNSAGPLSDSNDLSQLPWATPRNVRQFAGQANEVATRILNGEMPIEVGRVYATLARVVAQTVTAEVQRARFLKQEPELTFDDPRPD